MKWDKQQRQKKTAKDNLQKSQDCQLNERKKIIEQLKKLFSIIWDKFFLGFSFRQNLSYLYPLDYFEMSLH